MFKDWFELSERQPAGGRLSRAHFGDWVKVNYLVNLKSGLCPEDCWYCSQRAGSAADVLKYSLLPADKAVRHADRLAAAGVDAYNHNINTSESRHQQICSTHDYAEADLEMIADARFRVLPDRDQPPGSRRERVAARRRGAGTDTAPNA